MRTTRSDNDHAHNAKDITMSDTYEKTTIVQTTQEDSQVFDHNGGPCYVTMQGNFGGATLTLQGSMDGGATYGVVTDIISSNTLVVAAGTTGAVFSGQILLPPCKLKLVSTSISGTTNVVAVFGSVI